MIGYLLLINALLQATALSQNSTGQPSDLELVASESSSSNQFLDPDIIGVRHFINDLLQTKNNQDVDLQEGRTFGHKRIQFMLMPLMYKMGVMMTLLTILTVISLKGLFVGVTLLVLKLASFLAKFYTGWNQHQGGGWPQPVHVHLHSSHPYAHGQAYSGWDPVPATGPSPEDDHYYYKG